MIGDLKDELLDAVLDAVPAELTVIDRNDRVVAWNRHDSRVFKRDEGIIGTDIRECHSDKSMDILERMLDDMKRGEIDSARFWYDEQMGEGDAPHKLLVEYFALRDGDGVYIGCLAVTQDIEEIRSLEGEKRSLP